MRMKSRRPGRSVASKLARRSAGSSSTGTRGTKSFMPQRYCAFSVHGRERRLALIRVDLRGGYGVALDVDLGQDPIEPAGQPPVLVAQQLHRGRYEQEPHDGG